MRPSLHQAAPLPCRSRAGSAYSQPPSSQLIIIIKHLASVLRAQAEPARVRVCSVSAQPLRRAVDEEGRGRRLDKLPRWCYCRASPNGFPSPPNSCADARIWNLHPTQEPEGYFLVGNPSPYLTVRDPVCPTVNPQCWTTSWRGAGGGGGGARAQNTQTRGVIVAKTHSQRRPSSPAKTSGTHRVGVEAPSSPQPPHRNLHPLATNRTPGRKEAFNKCLLK